MDTYSEYKLHTYRHLSKHKLFYNTYTYVEIDTYFDDDEMMTRIVNYDVSLTDTTCRIHLTVSLRSSAYVLYCMLLLFDI